MSTHDYNLENQTGADLRTDLNNVLEAIASNNASDTEPTTTFPYMLWADTSTDTLKQRNTDNDGWVDILTLSTGMSTSGTTLTQEQLDAIAQVSTNTTAIAAIDAKGSPVAFGSWTSSDDRTGLYNIFKDADTQVNIAPNEITFDKDTGKIIVEKAGKYQIDASLILYLDSGIGTTAIITVEINNDSVSSAFYSLNETKQAITMNLIADLAVGADITIKASSSVNVGIGSTITLQELGVKGDTGDTGIQGIQGDIGVKGDTGDTGIQGIQGDIGEKGLQGVQGDIGEKGLQGVQGDIGEKGLQGIQGDIGEKGLQGVQGSATLSEAELATLAQADRNTSSISKNTDQIAVNTTNITNKSDSDHIHTKSDIGLGNINNTSDLNKPISTATQTAIDNIDTSSVSPSYGSWEFIKKRIITTTSSRVLFRVNADFVASTVNSKGITFSRITGKFTVAEAGNYLVSYSLTGTFNPAGAINCQLIIGTTTASTIGWQGTTTSNGAHYYAREYTRIHSIKAGKEIYLILVGLSASTLTIYSDTSFTITKVG